jgi:peptidoglycan/LPS O-acetylase OafA/YrhL
VAHGKKIGHIEVLRGLAVTLVLFYHLRVPGFGFAYLGVDAFFVISGFLMALLYGDMAGREGVLDFYRRRLSRLLPAYYAILILSVLVAAMRALPHEFADAARYAYWSAILAPNIGFWLDASYFDSDYFRPMLNFWSLGVELQFYLVFPILAFAHRRWPKLVAAAALASLALFLLMSMVSPKTAFFQTPCRIWQFMAGFYIARIPYRSLPAWTGETALALLGGVILAAPFLPLGPAALAVAVTLLSTLFIAAGLAPRIDSSPPAELMKLLGKYSYSIYLVHFPIIVFIAYKPFAGTSLDLAMPWGYAAALILTGIVSVALYHLVEAPFRVRRSGRFVLGTMAVGALAASGAAAASAPVNRSLLPPREAQAVAAWFDRLPYRCPKLGRIVHPFDQSCPIAGSGGPTALLVGDSHSDVLKGVLGEAMERSGGNLRLMVENYAVGPELAPEAVMREAELRSARLIVLHSTADHVYSDAIRRLAALAAAKGMAVPLIVPVPEPGYHVPKQIYATLQAGQTPEPHRSLADYLERHRTALASLEALAGQAGNLRLFHPETFLCRPMCAIQDQAGRPLYSDAGHLSQTGVRLLAPMMREIAALADPRQASPPSPRG